MIADLSRKQADILRELVARMNAKRAKKHYQPVGLTQVPDLPGRHVQDYYLVDTYQVRRHWRRRPKRR